MSLMDIQITHTTDNWNRDTLPSSVFLCVDGEASWLLLPSLVSLPSGGTVQPENTYSCILKVTVQVWVW